jgi:hypothetical protein
MVEAETGGIVSLYARKIQNLSGTFPLCVVFLLQEENTLEGDL